jgi:urease accessory protein
MAADRRRLLESLAVRSGEPPLSAAALYRLTTWLSPAYPVGAFSYSSGLEWAVETDGIVDANTLTDWLEAMLTGGSGLSDGIFFCCTYRAAADDNGTALAEVAELAAAFAPTRERHLETTAMGRAFVDITQAAWPCAALNRLREVWDGAIAYPVAVGAACAGHDIPLPHALRAFVAAIAANWISAGARLVPLGQTDSQRVLARLEPVIAKVSAKALEASLDDLGGATFRADIASALHETQYTRLFRS